VAAEKGSCLRVFDGGTVDVAGWLRASALVPGDPAASPLCEALARTPGALAPPPAAASSSLVALVFPDNDVSQVRFSTTAELEAVLSPMIDALRSLGGTASQAAVSMRVDCGGPRQERLLVERPAALTPENDHEK
jgi:hypothetical protein